jgi:hypothetical protein
VLRAEKKCECQKYDTGKSTKEKAEEGNARQYPFMGTHDMDEVVPHFRRVVWPRF